MARDAGAAEVEIHTYSNGVRFVAYAMTNGARIATANPMWLTLLQNGSDVRNYARMFNQALGMTVPVEQLLSCMKKSFDVDNIDDTAAAWLRLFTVAEPQKAAIDNAAAITAGQIILTVRASGNNSVKPSYKKSHRRCRIVRATGIAQEPDVILTDLSASSMPIPGLVFAAKNVDRRQLYMAAKNTMKRVAAPGQLLHIILGSSKHKLKLEGIRRNPDRTLQPATKLSKTAQWGESSDEVGLRALRSERSIKRGVNLNLTTESALSTFDAEAVRLMTKSSRLPTEMHLMETGADRPDARRLLIRFRVGHSYITARLDNQ
jgi:hypothetical protein